MDGNVKECHRKKRIVIVGAGAAGLAAAAKLKEIGFIHVVVLEASDQVGGRIRTLQYDSNALEMGAQWIHGKSKNIVYDIADEHNLLNHEAPDYMISMYKLSNIDSVQDRIVIANTIKYLLKIMDSTSANLGRESFLSLAQHLKERFHDCFSDTDSIHIHNLKQVVFNWFLNLECELNGCETLDSVSNKLLGCYKECDGFQTVELKYGYSRVLDVFLAQIPLEWILLNKIVKSIDWGYIHGAGVKIVCEDSSVYYADHVIVTLPLGYLKKNAHIIFHPNLPAQKMKAIECIGFGTVNKIYLEFENPFWKPGDIFNVFWTLDIENHCNLYQYCRPWCKCINRFAYVLNQPKLLCAWVSGKGAVLMEDLTDGQIMHDCHYLLGQILSMKHLPEPCKIIRSHWHSEPFSFGSYSYLSVNSEIEHCSNMDLAEPVFKFSTCKQHPSLLFAGEATHPCFYSTVHGAVESGIREAKRIFAHYEMHQLLEVSNSFMRKVAVLIVGAGTAGLTCAQRCINSGLKDIAVLEALNRVGGRICTIDFEKSVLELGAQWVHGEKNVLFEYCSKFGLLEETGSSYEGKGMFCTSSGEIIPQYIVHDMFKVMERMKEKVNSCTSHLHESVEEAFENIFQEYLSECDDTQEYQMYKKGIFDWFKRFETIDNGCDNLRDLSLLSYTNWVDCPGSYNTDLINGYRSFIEHIENSLPEDVVKKSKPVRCIHWQKDVFKVHHCQQLNEQPISEFPVIVECEDGEYFAAQNVVVTSSIGFLNANVHSFFQPRLSKIKERTFAEIGFGTVNKIFLVFEKRFWKQDDLGFQLIWIDDAAKEKYCTPEDSWVSGITGFDRVRNLPNVLLAWVGGFQSKQMEDIEPISVGCTCTRILRQFLNNPDLPFPIKVIRSSWYKNPYMKGSFSNRPAEFFTSECRIKDLQEPVYCNVTLHNGRVVQWPAVTFAGEALDMQYFSSVHGAMQSGISESDRIVKFYRDLQKMD